MIMTQKVFISSLGTNNNLQIRYVLGRKKSPLVRFVQQAVHDCNRMDAGQEFNTSDIGERIVVCFDKHELSCKI